MKKEMLTTNIKKETDNKQQTTNYLSKNWKQEQESQPK